MREVPPDMTAAWLAPDKTGDRRPVVRATLQKVKLIRHEYDTSLAPGGDWETQRPRTGNFTTIVMGSDGEFVELRNIKTFTWSRSVNQDVAEATMTLHNAEVVPIGTANDFSTSDDFERPGEMTFSRGDGTLDDNPWGYPTDNAWNGSLVPDRLVRTYEGYGIDQNAWPAMDANLIQSGTWLIDDVDYNADGNIELKLRDVGRMLIDEICFPPVIPLAEYPLEFSKIRTENVPGRDTTGGSWVSLTRSHGDAISSNDEYVGEGLTNPPYPHYVTSNGSFNGHHANHVLESGDGYWQSTGQTTYNSRVWWQINLDDNTPMNGIRLRPQGGPYRVYISLHNGTKWLGRREIPYTVTTEGVDIGADIPYVKSYIADKNLTFDAILPRVYGSINKIRITFTRLQDTAVGAYPFRAGLRDIRIYTAGSSATLASMTASSSRPSATTATSPTSSSGAAPGAASSGPRTTPTATTSSGAAMLSTTLTWKTTGPSSPTPPPTPCCPRAASGATSWTPAPPANADLTVDLFDKQPLMDVINYVRDIVGFLFCIDEAGGTVWRMPNLWSLGNYLSPTQPLGRGR